MVEGCANVLVYSSENEKLDPDNASSDIGVAGVPAVTGSGVRVVGVVGWLETSRSEISEESSSDRMSTWGKAEGLNCGVSSISEDICKGISSLIFQSKVSK